MKTSANRAEGFAGSLVELAKVDVGLDVVDRDLRLIKETVIGHMDLKKTIADGSLSVVQKQSVIREIFQDKVADVTLNFLEMLVAGSAMDLLPKIADNFAKRLEAEENKVVADVTTAVPIDAKFSVRLAEKLSDMVGREVTIRSKTDASLVGGVVVRVGGKLLDGSVRNQLDRMRRQMLIDMRGK